MMPKEDLFPGEQIKIVCRIRPFLAHETEKAAVFVNNAHTITLENKKDPTKQFAYNKYAVKRQRIFQR
ncbi:hypothetical protein [Absidia glauca]|uniref:Kinesin motor domain-containing protein n=1 Tax=Absidia glauca TaxID=4829 RepID=A0A163JRB1_ABSGL|nr:hypothetical protein [Absidia glauca]